MYVHVTSPALARGFSALVFVDCQSRSDCLNLQTRTTRLERLDSGLDTRSIRVSRIEDQVKSFEFRVTVNLHLTGTVFHVIHDGLRERGT